ncbi:thioredoxin domain-containing protein [Rubrobacter indicoceani]|uniref:thioredoxin domain-containing protein n=1 Tax=Rubrobacter indicoceani TaxID=2051957 RepID=UPI000E5B22F2|nr:thioredoxin domain-containing protein [Rubrobacter indicoceani]
MPNRLADETSPYLLQHRNNPVDWYPWGEEALAKSKAEGKPILLSVGYSSCHWCHVMERESFEDDATADVMNRHFINIKVDREERPDIDSIYMSALQAMTRSGGWPMTVFLTPEGAPFYAGTYFPPTPRQGLPSFTQLLTTLADAYENRRDEVLESADKVREFLEASTSGQLPKTALNRSILDAAASALTGNTDRVNGGFGDAPKFPQAMNVEVLLRHHARTGDADSLAAAEVTLQKMASGGIYDHLGGGFARYAVDARWLVPHFEKMLYDNALLTRLYTEAYQLTKNKNYLRVAQETTDYVLRDLTDSGTGGFYSAEDADSEGVEGKFYVWDLRELTEALDPDELEAAVAYYNVTERGNFEGRNILNVKRGRPEVAATLGISEEDLDLRLGSAKEKLLIVRERRVRPGLDDKTLAAWNGLMLRSVALLAAVTGRSDYLEAARRNATFLVEKMKSDVTLLRSYKDGEARISGYLEDYAMVADGLLALFEADGDVRWLNEAVALADAMNGLFWDKDLNAFFDTPEGHEELITRPRDFYDSATPSGNSVAAEVLLRLALLTSRADYRERGEAVLEGVSGAMEQLPAAFGRALAALDFHLASPREVVIVGGGEDAERLRRAAYSVYLPNSVFALAGEDPEEASKLVPLLENRPLRGGRATAYICEGYVCQQPTTDADEMLGQLTA